MKKFILTFTNKDGSTNTRTIETHNVRMALHQGLSIREDEGLYELTSVDPA